MHRRVMDTSVGVVSAVTVGDLDRPTPCSAWTLRELLEHLVGQNHGFAAAVEGAGPERTLFAPRPVGDDPVGVYVESAERVLAAFAASQLDDQVWLAEVSTQRQFSTRLAVRFHFVDYVVHSWDVARSLGRTVEFDDDLLAEALDVAMLVPDGPARLVAGASFQPALAAADDVPTLDRTLARLGRDSGWTTSS